MLMIKGLALLSLLAGAECIKFKQVHQPSTGAEAFPAPLLIAQPASSQTGYYQAPFQEPELHTANEGVKGDTRYATKSRAPAPVLAAPAYAQSYAAPQTLAYVFLRPIQYVAPLAIHHEQHYSEPTPIRQSEQLATKGAPIQQEQAIVEDSSAPKGAKIAKIKDSIDRLTSAALSKLAFSSYRVEKEELLPPPAQPVPEPVQQQIKEQEIIQDNEPLQQTQLHEQEPVKGRELPPVQQHQEVKGQEVAPVQQQLEQQELKGHDLAPVQQQHELKELPAVQQKAEVKGRDLPPPLVQQQEEDKPTKSLEPQREAKGREILPVQQQREIPTLQQEEKGRELTQSQQRYEAKGRELEPVQQKQEAKGREPQASIQQREVKGVEPTPLPAQKEIKGREIEPVQQQQHLESKGRELDPAQQQREAKGRELPLPTAQIYQEHNEFRESQLQQEKFEEKGYSQTREQQQEESSLRELPQPVLREQEPDLAHELRANANADVGAQQDDYARGPIADWTLRRPQNRLRSRNDLGLGRRS